MGRKKKIIPNVDFKRLGEFVSEERERLGGLSPEQFGARAGVSFATVYNIERGKPTTLKTLSRVAAALDMPIDTLLWQARPIVHGVPRVEEQS